MVTCGDNNMTEAAVDDRQWWRRWCGPVVAAGTAPDENDGATAATRRPLAVASGGGDVANDGHDTDAAAPGRLDGCCAAGDGRPVGHRGRRAGDVILLGRRPGVLALAVPAQVHLPLERLVAEPARKRLVARVLAQVRDQVGRLAERLAAHHALVRFLACSPGESKKKKKTQKPLVYYLIQMHRGVTYIRMFIQ